MPVQLEDFHEGGITFTTLRIAHPPLNILDLDHCRELSSLIHQIRADDRCRVVVLRGDGSCFSAGVDIEQHTAELMPELLPAFHEVFHALLGLRAVTIAAVHGHCMGGAAELVFACDRAIAEETARISLPEIKVGCYPPVAIPLLCARIGQGRASEMILTGEGFPVARLVEWGLVDRVVPRGELDAGVSEERARYHGKSPSVLGMAAALLHEEARRAWGDRIPALEGEYLEKLLPHPDATEGIAAFQERRPPRWAAPEEGIDPQEALR
ncbi:MAG: enoyl-CoA hydratase/isomerase family protein [Planctomycetota bacterium]